MAKTATALLMLGLTTLNATAQPLAGMPGTLVDIGGRRLHLRCTGSGSPTVILESGASSFAIDWTLVQPDVARTNRSVPTTAQVMAGAILEIPRRQSVSRVT